MSSFYNTKTHSLFFRNPGSSSSERRSRLYTAITIAENCSALRERRALLPSQRGRLFDKTPLRRKNAVISDDDDDDDDTDAENEIEDSDTEDEEEDDDFLENVDNTEYENVLQ